MALLAATAAAGTASADPVADFYKGKELTIQIGFGAGGGYDATARLFALHAPRHIPGNPSIIVQNMPGAGSMKAANNLATVAPKDGTVLGIFASSTALEPLFGNKAALYDPRKFGWIGSLHRDIASCGVWNGGGQGIKTLPDLISAKRTVLFGSTSPTAITSQHVWFMKNMFGANVKVVYGYKGTKDVSLAMMRGEVDGTCGMMESSVRGAFDQHIKSDELKIVVQFGRDRAVPYFGDATQMYKMLKTQEQKQLADAVFRMVELARPFAAPPGTPPDRLAALRKAMLETMADPAMVADAKRMQIEFEPVPGDETAQIFSDYYALPAALLEQARQYTQPDN